MADFNQNTEYARKRKIRMWKSLGWSDQKILDYSGMPESFVKAYLSNPASNHYLDQNEHREGVSFSGKNEPYYDPTEYSEDDLINLPPVYFYEDLTPDEKRIFKEVSLNTDWKGLIRTMNIMKNTDPDPRNKTELYYELHSTPISDHKHSGIEYYKAVEGWWQSLPKERRQALVGIVLVRPNFTNSITHEERARIFNWCNENNQLNN